MALTQQEQQAFWNWLAARGIQTECPFCHAPHNQQAQNLQCGDLIEAPSVTCYGKVRMLQVVCIHCGFVSLFSIDPTKSLP